MGQPTWNSKIGFYLVAIGSAFGLGSLWRFPYVVEDNGGGAFVWLYIGLVFVAGMPLLIGEILLGKVKKASLLKAISIDAQETNTWVKLCLPKVGPFIVLVCMVLLAYYSVVCGWVLHFISQFSVALVNVNAFDGEKALSALFNSGWLQVGLTSAHILLAIVVVAKDFEEGIEHWISQLSPIFVILLAILAWTSMPLVEQEEALRFFLYPDFSKLNLSSLNQAIGHMLFTLSIGFGTMVTFGSYLSKEVFVPKAGFRVAMLDSFTAILAGLVVFPLVFASSTSARGPELLFETLPVLFSRIKGGYILGVIFFTCLYLAALGATIAILETIVANLKEWSGINRNKATWLVGGVCFVISMAPALSSTVLSGVRILGLSVFEAIDIFLVNWFLPLLALIVSQYIVYKLPEKDLFEQFEVEDQQTTKTLFKHWIYCMKYGVPVLILGALFLQILAFFNF